MNEHVFLETLSLCAGVATRCAIEKVSLLNGLTCAGVVALLADKRFLAGVILHTTGILER